MQQASDMELVTKRIGWKVLREKPGEEAPSLDALSYVERFFLAITSTTPGVTKGVPDSMALVIALCSWRTAARQCR